MSLLEPEIIYGAFDENNFYKPIRAGSVQTSALVGWGINNLPDGLWGTVSESADCSTLEYYLKMAKETYENQRLQRQFDEIENPIELLWGMKIRRMWIYADECVTEGRFGDHDTLIKLRLLYGTSCMVTGLMTPEEITTEIDDARNRYEYPLVTSVEGDKITLSSGAVFHLTSRYRFNTRPTPSVDRADYKHIIMRNLASMRAVRDSEVEPA